MIRFWLFAVILLITIFVGVAFANFNQAKEELALQFENYTKIRQEYLTARAKYQQFKTLPSETEAFAAFKKVLAARAKVLENYFTLLLEKLSQTQAIGESNKNELTNQINAEGTYFAEFQKRAESFKNLQEAEAGTLEFEQKRKHWQTQAAKMRSITFSSGVLATIQNSVQVAVKIENFLAASGKNLADVNLREEKIRTAKSKLTEAGQKATIAQSAFLEIGPDSQEFEISRLNDEGKKNAESAKTLLTEAITLMTEAARGF